MECRLAPPAGVGLAGFGHQCRGAARHAFSCMVARQGDCSGHLVSASDLRAAPAATSRDRHRCPPAQCPAAASTTDRHRHCRTPATPRRDGTTGPRARKIARIDGSAGSKPCEPRVSRRPLRDTIAWQRVPALVHLADDRRHARIAAVVPARRQFAPCASSRIARGRRAGAFRRTPRALAWARCRSTGRSKRPSRPPAPPCLPRRWHARVRLRPCHGRRR